MAERAVSRVSRRSVLKRTAAGVAVAGGLATLPGWALAATELSSHETDSPADATVPTPPLVAYVRDASKGEIALLVGDQEIVCKNPSLVARLLSAVRAA